MRTVIVDSTVWVDYFGGTSNPETRWLDSAIGRESIGLTDLILCEVLQGIREDRQFEEVKVQLLEFDIFSSGGLETAEAVAANYRRLKEKGFTVRKTIDCWIASFCLREGYALLHRDHDFVPFESELGLRVVKV